MKNNSVNWIPVKKQLPTVPGEYLVTYENGRVSTRTWFQSEDSFHTYIAGWEIIAWAEFPEGYKEDK